jgi:3-hydroxyisobutyrate dehydrogenase-like beta-hydroxyacid dehydrogenase
MAQGAVGFIGLGVMGEPMCRNLKAKCGRRVLAYDIDPAPLARLAAAGVEVLSDAAAVVAASEVVFVSMPSGKVLDELVHAANGLLAPAHAGQVLVDLGTSPVKLTRALGAQFAARGAHWLDAPVARTRAAAEAGTLSVMVGGEAEVFARVKPLLECFATEITHCGALGSGQVVKILNNMVLFETVAALSEARAIGASAGVDARLLFETLAKGSADSFALRNHGLKAIIPGDFPLRTFSVEYALKDLEYALELAAEAGVDAAGACRVESLFRRAIDQGLGARYHPVISDLLGGREIS